MKNKFSVVIAVLAFSFASFTPYELQKKSILNNKVEILLPAEFKIMSEEMMKLKYPSNNRPTLIYSNEPGTINVAFNHTASRATQNQILLYKENLMATFKNVYPTAEWKGSGIKEINGRKVGYLEVVTPAIDTKVYNLIFFTDLDGRLLLCTFNCVVESLNQWKEDSQKIMNSLFMK